MSQLSFLGLEAQVWTVGDLNRHVRQVLENDYRLTDLWVAGEVANFSRPASGHLYFTLSDSNANLRCVMWRSQAARLERLPRDGEAVEVHGHISVYEAGGQYQLYADQIRPAGEGDRYQAFLRLKAKLEAEGLFDPERKRPLPAWPRRVGLATSATGAALRDVLHVLARRYPLLQVILAPTSVQGDAAPLEIVAALAALNQYAAPDVIVLTRGGGSLEDLWAFNDERVVRAVAASAAPLVSGVGHETDLVLTDFAADQRAPTPSAAAELITPDQQDLRQDLAHLERRLARHARAELLQMRQALRELQNRMRFVSPSAAIGDARQRIDELARRAAIALRHKLALRRAAADALSQTLRAVGPQAILARGYALVRRADDGSLVRSVGQVAAGVRLNVRLSDGTIKAGVLTVKLDKS